MKATTLFLAVAAMLISSAEAMAADGRHDDSGKIKHVLLLSIDGMHAVDFYNCSHGIAGREWRKSVLPEHGSPRPDGDQLRGHHFFQAIGLFSRIAALVTGGSPKSTGIYYDVAYDRSLDPPVITTGTGLAGGTCTPIRGADRNNDRLRPRHRIDDTKLNGGAPGAAPTEGGIASIDPKIGARPGQGLRAGLSVGFRPDEHNFQRGSCGGRIHGLDRQARVVFLRGRARRQGPE